MPYKKFDILEKEFACLPPPEKDYVPDFEKIKRTARSEQEYLLFLIWYQAVSDENEKTKTSVSKAWDEINDMLVLY